MIRAHFHGLLDSEGDTTGLDWQLIAYPPRPGDLLRYTCMGIKASYRVDYLEWRYDTDTPELDINLDFWDSDSEGDPGRETTVWVHPAGWTLVTPQ